MDLIIFDLFSEINGTFFYLFLSQSTETFKVSCFYFLHFSPISGDVFWNETCYTLH